MCGIAGYFGSGDSDLLKEMLKTIWYRGPDSEGMFFDEHVGLGVRRLAIIDVNHGNQPIHNEKKSLWIVYNGEIYNFQYVRKKLIALGHKFYTFTDTETVLHAYEEWNEGCVNHFNGMFAFAIWDTMKKRLFIARDRLGIKPLYFHFTSKKFLFASEIKALLVDVDTPKVPNDSAVCQYLLTGFQYTDETFFSGIKELPPGYYMIIDEHGKVSTSYWKITDSLVNEKADLDNLSERFLELFSDAITIRIPSEQSVGTFLSGGLDSSSIACITENIIRHKKLNNPQLLISAFYDEKSSDESPSIEEVSKLVNKKVKNVYPSTVKTWEDIRTFVYHLDEPVPVLNYYAYWCLSRITSGLTKVTFSGQGPDELLGGHNDHFIRYLGDLWKKKQIKKIVREIISSLPRYGISNVLSYVVKTLALRGIRVEQLLNAEFVATNKKSIKKPNSLRSQLIFDVTKRRLPVHLRAGDRISSAFSLESRVPYLDYRLVEFSFSLPSDKIIFNGSTKFVLRSAVKDLIPKSILERKKMGTPIPIENWLKDYKKEIMKIFKSKKFRERKYFNHSAVIDVFDRFCSGNVNKFEEFFYGYVIWRILNVELWLETFFD